MSLLAVEKLASDLVADELIYNPDRWNLSSLMQKRTDVGEHAFVGPQIVGVARPMEQSVAIPGIYPWVMQWADKHGLYTTGTVAVSGATVTGTSTAWKTAGVPVGARIGFGTTDREAVTQWYNITAIASDTSITLNASPGTITAGTAFVIDMNMQKDWVFLADNATAAATRRIIAYEYNRLNSTFSWKGYVTLTYPTTTNHTIRGFRMTYDKYTEGTVAVSGATVTGTNSAWVTHMMTKAQSTMAGSRIGFGSTDPTQIDKWYHINTITADGTMTIAVNATGTLVAANITIAAGTPYVIEDLRCITVTTNATAANGGLFVAKGLSWDKFLTTGSTILGTATTGIDANMTNVYWIADAATNTNIASVGIALEPRITWDIQLAYVLDTTGGIKVYKFNVRAAMSITTGASAPYKDIVGYTSAGSVQTGAGTVTGTVATTNNGRFAKLLHGPLANTDAIYFVTTTRIYGFATANVTSGSTSFLTYTMTEVPPGGAVTFLILATMACIEYSSVFDRLIVSCSGSGGRIYLTKFRTDGGPMDHIFCCDDRQIDQASADSAATPHFGQSGVTQSIWAESGVLYTAGIGTWAAANVVHAGALGADWNYTSITNERIITPRLLTPNCSKFHRFYFVRDRVIGDENLGKSADPVKWFYRTAGISDDSGAWTEIPEPHDLSGVTANSEIQFACEFKMLTEFCVPTRIHLVGVIYQDLSTESHYQPSSSLSIASTKQFAWRHATAFGTTVPALRVRLYNAETGGLLLDDNTSNPTYGTFNKSTDGGTTWTAFNTTDKANENTYLRYIPSSLGDNIKVRALLTQL